MGNEVRGDGALEGESGRGLACVDVQGNSSLGEIVPAANVINDLTFPIIESILRRLYC